MIPSLEEIYDYLNLKYPPTKENKMSTGAAFIDRPVHGGFPNCSPRFPWYPEQFPDVAVGKLSEAQQKQVTEARKEIKLGIPKGEILKTAESQGCYVDLKFPYNDIDYLKWFHNRLITVHGENQYYDYMHKFRAIINRLETKGEANGTD